MPAERAQTTKSFKPQRPSNNGGGASTSASASASRQSRPSQSQSEPEPEAQDAEQPPAIPAELLTTLLHEFFTDDRTRISKAANEAVAKYMETFIKEAIVRAAYERRQVAGSGGGVGEFLEVCPRRQNFENVEERDG